MLSHSVVLALFCCAAAASTDPIQERRLRMEEPRESDIESWVQDLTNSDLDEREEAASKILRAGSRALPVLEETIKTSKNTELRWNAKRLLREIREKQYEEKDTPAPRRSEGGQDERMGELRRALAEKEKAFQGMKEEHLEQLHRLLRDKQSQWHQADLFDDDDDNQHPQVFMSRGFDMPDIMDFDDSNSMIQNLSVTQGPDGIRVETFQNRDGKEDKSVYEAPSVEEFKEKYPDIAKKYGIGREGKGTFTFRIGGQGLGGRFGTTFTGTNNLRVTRPGVALAETSLPTDRLGVMIDNVEPSLSSYLDLPEGVGFIVRDVEQESLAERMGVQEKDVLIAINGKQIRGRDVILKTLKDAEVGDSINVEVYRSGSGKMTLNGKKQKSSESKMRFERELEKAPRPR